MAKFQDHQKLLNIKGPAIIIAGSGMCIGGRIDWVRAMLHEPPKEIRLVHGGN